MPQEMNFRVYFNHGKQYFDVFVADSQRRFMNANKCWAYYQPEKGRRSRRGCFGSVHFSKLGSGLVAHELCHLWLDWCRTGRAKGRLNPKNEEYFVIHFGEITRNFWRKYYQVVGKTTI